MKKIIFLTAFASLLSAFAAEDSFIYWMVPEIATGTDMYGQTLGGTYTAKISAFKNGAEWSKTGGTYLDIYSVAGNGGLGSKVEGGPSVTLSDTANNVAYYVNLLQGNTQCYGDGWTYFVELYNGGAVVARSEGGLPYSQESIAALSSGTIATPGELWMPMTFVPAPEPNSAMLLLIGCAALALRRRKQVAA